MCTWSVNRSRAGVWHSLLQCLSPVSLENRWHLYPSLGTLWLTQHVLIFRVIIHVLFGVVVAVYLAPENFILWHCLENTLVFPCCPVNILWTAGFQKVAGAPGHVWGNGCLTLCQMLFSADSKQTACSLCCCRYSCLFNCKCGFPLSKPYDTDATLRDRRQFSSFNKHYGISLLHVEELAPEVDILLGASVALLHFGRMLIETVFWVLNGLTICLCIQERCSGGCSKLYMCWLWNPNRKQ